MKGCIVCNTGPLIALAVVHRLDLLHALFEEVLIPEKVRDELLAGTRGRDEIEDALSTGWLRPTPVMPPPEPVLDDVLDVGEAAVIQLARQVHADWVLIDERKGRKIAADVYDLRVAGTARIAVEAKRKQLVTDVGELLSSMRFRGYWISDRIVLAARNMAGETADE